MVRELRVTLWVNRWRESVVARRWEGESLPLYILWHGGPRKPGVRKDRRRCKQLGMKELWAEGGVQMLA